MKKITKTNKLPARKVTTEDTKRISMALVKLAILPTKALEELTKNQLPYVPLGVPVSDELWKNAYSLSLSHGTESGLFLAENMPKEYRSLAVQMKLDLEKEFACNKIYEKALIDQIINGYIKNLHYSWLLSSGQKFEFFDNTKNGYFCFLSKECDRSFRQYISGIEMLRSLKQPKLNLKFNIKSKNAFVAEKQQFNNNQHEINKPE